VFGQHRRKRSSKEGMCIGKKREVAEKGRNVLGGAQGRVLCNLKASVFVGKAQRAPLGARVLLVPQRGGERTHTPSGASEATSNRCQARRAFDDGGGCLSKRQIVKTKPESQWIVITRPLYHLQQPVSYSSRLQVIHRPGSGNCDRSRLMQYGCAWLPPGGRKLVFQHGF
jgi:hypothetical protein